EPASDLGEKAVARRMTIRIVDFLESVEVDAKDRKILVADRRAVENLCKMIAECGAVRQIGELIVKRQVRDPGLALPALGDILMGGDPAAVLVRPVCNVDDPAVGQFRDKAVGQASLDRRLQPCIVLAEVPVRRSCFYASLKHLFEGTSHK